MMAEYIEREYLIKRLKKRYNDPNYWHAGEDWRMGLSLAKDIVDEIPACYVAEVRHGEWLWDVETHGDPMYGVDEDFGYRCSECKIWADEWGVDGDIYEEPPTRLHYCPNCGAKMDGKGENDA